MKTIVLAERDEQIRLIRPDLPEAGRSGSAIDNFQNNTLKPILDFQTDLVLAQFKEYLEKHKTRFYSFNREAQRDFIRDILMTDLSLRNLLVPMVTGLFTLKEFQFFASHRAQVARRIQQLIIRQVQDRVEALY